MTRLLIALLLVGCPAPQKPRPPTPLDMIEASADLDGARVGPSKSRATVVVLMASWCGHCRAQLAQLAALRDAHPDTRIIGVNYKGHEEYDNRGNAEAIRAYVAEHVPWLRVVPADERLFGALGKPPFIPAVWIYASDGRLVEFFDRREREPPTLAELEAALRTIN